MFNCLCSMPPFFSFLLFSFFFFAFYFVWRYDTISILNTPHYTTLHCTAPHCTALHYTCHPELLDIQHHIPHHFTNTHCGSKYRNRIKLDHTIHGIAITSFLFVQQSNLIFTIESWSVSSALFITTQHDMTWHDITYNHFTSHHITSHHITSHHITSHHITSHHITSHHITSHHITSYRTVCTPHPSRSPRCITGSFSPSSPSLLSLLSYHYYHHHRCVEKHVRFDPTTHIIIH